ncbi:MAG: TonB-dependent receptor [Chryseotalea sp. WA131a]|nr:MAG: TonB-dependent receptor [Chryseotalea sp. WA131a]
MRFILLIITFLCINFASFCQRLIEGKVLSGDDKQPLPGVSIGIEGTTRGTISDANGDFQLEVKDSDKALAFSFVGYKPTIVQLTGQNRLEVTLQPDVMNLDEVVVIGYGTVNKSDLTGAVSSLKSADLTKVPALNPMQALQGRLAGVQVSSSSGAPGAAPVVRIRGVGTFNNSAPIYVVDGMILDDINFLNSADIKSVEVLKDASATVIYGSRGANGVIIITTKQGNAGNKETPTVFEVNSEYSLQTLQRKIDLLKGREFAQVVNDFKPGTYNNVDALPNTDWQDLVFKQAPLQNFNVSASGSSSKIQYYVGVGYFNQEGIIPNSSFERLTVKINNTFKLTDRIRLGNNMNIAPTRQQNTNSGVVFAAYRAWPTLAPYQVNDGYTEVPGVGNPLADLEYTTNNFSKGLRTLSNTYLEVDLPKGFSFKTSYNFDFQYNKNDNFVPVFFVSAQQQNSLSTLSKRTSDEVNWLWENILNYKKTIGKHRIDALSGYTMQNSSSEFTQLGARNIIRDSQDFWYLNNNNFSSVENGVDLNRNFSMISFLGRANYVFNDRYLVTVSFRRDGSSKFSENNRYANFYSLALGWNLIEEEFIKKMNVFSNLKIRGSWGGIGNEKITYRDRFSSVSNGLNTVFNGTLQPGSSFGGLGNPNLKWETTYQLNVGLEAGFFDDRLAIEIDYFNRRTEGILIPLSVPGHLGNAGAQVTFNAGQVTNRGLEVNVKYDGNVGGLGYKVGGNTTFIQNEVNTVSGDVGVGNFLRGGNVFGAFVTLSTPGSPIGSFFGYQTNGVFQNAAELAAYPRDSQAGVGDLRFADTNNDGKITPEDRVVLGSPIPTFLYGFNLELNFRNFDLSADFQGEGGAKIYNAKATIRPDLYNFEASVIDRWRGEGTSNTEPRATQGGYNFLPSNRFIQDASFFRLRTLSLGYSFPKTLASKAGMRVARIYIRSTNLFTLTQFTGYSPEIASENVTDNRVDRGSYPVAIIYSVGLNISF